jgi:cell division protein YceG involved in septum cleavage
MRSWEQEPQDPSVSRMGSSKKFFASVVLAVLAGMGGCIYLQEQNLANNARELNEHPERRFEIKDIDSNHKLISLTDEGETLETSIFRAPEDIRAESLALGLAKLEQNYDVVDITAVNEDDGLSSPTEALIVEVKAKPVDQQLP